MDQVFSRWLSELSFKKGATEGRVSNKGAVGAAARLYEAARNALEYRAEHLIRRAAIERILRRELTLKIEAEAMADHLDQELSWADYTGESEEQHKLRKQIVSSLERYRHFISESNVPKDFLIGMMSAEIENMLNPNSDFALFAKLGYAYMRRKFSGSGAEIDLPLTVAVERVMNQTDDQVVGFRLYLLIQSQTHFSPVEAIKKTYEIFMAIKRSKYFNRMSNLVKKNIGPVILLRDMYFTNQEEFLTVLADREAFEKMAGLVFDEQVYRMKERINRATVRSLIYIFLTKMLFVLLLEIPMQKLGRSEIDMLAMGINLVLPLGLMWFLAVSIRLPDNEDKKKLMSEAWDICRELSVKSEEKLSLVVQRSRMGEVVSRVFYLLYGGFSLIIFSGIIWGLARIGFGLVDMIIFVFFTSVVSFFAFRIRQNLVTYRVKRGRNREETMVDMLLLPLVVTGSAVSKEVSRLNFLIFIFDFVLEAPFKSILRFVDGWFEFLSVKKEEVIE